MSGYAECVFTQGTQKAHTWGEQESKGALSENVSQDECWEALRSRESGIHPCYRRGKKTRHGNVTIILHSEKVKMASAGNWVVSILGRPGSCISHSLLFTQNYNNRNILLPGTWSTAPLLKKSAGKIESKKSEPRWQRPSTHLAQATTKNVALKLPIAPSLQTLPPVTLLRGRWFQGDDELREASKVRALKGARKCS